MLVDYVATKMGLGGGVIGFSIVVVRAASISVKVKEHHHGAIQPERA